MGTKEILEWDGATTITRTPLLTHNCRRHWGIVPELNVFCCVGEGGPSDPNINYARVNMTATPMAVGSVAEYTILTSFADILANSSVVSASNSLFVASAIERTNGNTGTDQLAMFWSLDGITWSAEHLCTLPVAANSGVSGVGFAARILWTGGENWLFAYRDTTGKYQLMPFTIDTGGF